MSTKQAIIKILEQNIGVSVSGADIASSLGLSRNSIWKAIRDLRTDGYPINATTNKGYSLSATSDILSPQGIGVFLTNPTLSTAIQVHPTLPSTNQKAKQLATEGASSPTIIIAEQQTAGKGRMGRSFYAPPKSGIYMSLLLRPNLSAKDSTLITTAASVAVCRAIKLTIGESAGIKWVNDIIFRKKKVCGILTEAVTNFEDGTIDYVVLGIGVNVATEYFPPEIRTIAGSLLAPGRGGITRNQLAAAILNELFVILENLESRDFMPEYRSLSVVIGKDVEVIEHTRSYIARAIGISDDGGLIIKTSEGTKTLMSGEISIKGDFYNDEV